MFSLSFQACDQQHPSHTHQRPPGVKLPGTEGSRRCPAGPSCSSHARECHVGHAGQSRGGWPTTPATVVNLAQDSVNATLILFSLDNCDGKTIVTLPLPTITQTASSRRPCYAGPVTQTSSRRPCRAGLVTQASSRRPCRAGLVTQALSRRPRHAGLITQALSRRPHHAGLVAQALLRRPRYA